MQNRPLGIGGKKRKKKMRGKRRKRWVEDVGKRGRRGRVRIEEILVLCNTVTELKPRIRAR